jgi:hypothetical protein
MSRLFSENDLYLLFLDISVYLSRTDSLSSILSLTTSALFRECDPYILPMLFHLSPRTASLTPLTASALFIQTVTIIFFSWTIPALGRPRSLLSLSSSPFAALLSSDNEQYLLHLDISISLLRTASLTPLTASALFRQ